MIQRDGGPAIPTSALVEPTVLKSLYRANAWSAGAAIVRQWAVIVLAVLISEWSGSWLVTVPALVVVATRQHGLLVLMHDGAHHLLARNRVINDLMSNVTLSFPLTVSTSRYREHHARHHKYVNRPDDPDLGESNAPPTVRGLVLLLLHDLNLVKSLGSLDRFGMLGAFRREAGVPPHEWTAFFVFAAALLTILAITDGWRIAGLYWVVPMFFVLPVLLRIRGLSEHAGRLDGGRFTHARSIDVGLVERIVFAPCSVNRHLEHHLFPHVPSYRLETLANILRENRTFLSSTIITKGYLFGPKSMLREIFPATAREERIAL